MTAPAPHVSRVARSTAALPQMSFNIVLTLDSSRCISVGMEHSRGWPRCDLAALAAVTSAGFYEPRCLICVQMKALRLSTVTYKDT